MGWGGGFRWGAGQFIFFLQIETFCNLFAEGKGEGLSITLRLLTAVLPSAGRAAPQMAARRRLRDRAALGGPRHQPLQRGELAAGVLARHAELLPDLQPRPLPRHTGGANQSWQRTFAKFHKGLVSKDSYLKLPIGYDL